MGFSRIYQIAGAIYIVSLWMVIIHTRER
jgi:hypothetical protein